MNSQNVHKLPVIDLTSEESLKPGTNFWLSNCKKVRNALEEYGSFMIVYDKVPQKLSSAIAPAMQQLFDLPSETKAKNTTEVHYLGYVPPKLRIPLYESLAIDDSTSPGAIKSFTNLMWPSGNKEFYETTKSYVVELAKLYKLVIEMMFQSYGVQKYCDSHMASASLIFRTIKYLSPRMDESQVGLLPHTDLDFITLLQQINPVQGLEVQSKDGTWFSVTPPLESFIVFAGDATIPWSNGRIRSCPHRVTLAGNQERYSIALFSYHKGLFQGPEELVDEEHPLQFKPYDHLDYFRFADTDWVGRLSMGSEGRIRLFCGI